MNESVEPIDTRILLRRCVTCRNLFLRTDLIRVVHDKSRQRWVLQHPGETDHSVFGRSAYVCSVKNCLAQALKGKRLQKALKTLIPDAIVLSLADILKGLDCGGSP